MPRVSSGIVLCVWLAAVAPLSRAAECHGKPDPNAQPNMNPINTASPVLSRSVQNGKAYRAGPADGQFWVLHLWGTPYEMGYAHGSMMKDEANGLVSDVWKYLEQQVEEALSGLPNWLSEDIANFGLDVALDLTNEWTKNFTGNYFYEELRGIADGAGVDYQTLVRIHMIGELTQAQCSMYGAWGAATKSTGKTLQLRALDWDIDGPFKNYAAVVVYHPNNGNGHAFANVGFVGWIGTLSGQSAAQMAVSEIGVAFPDDTFGKMSRVGIPFTFLLRDILQFDTSYNQSIARIQHANRTCDLILGVGDGKAKYFVGFEYSYSVADVITDRNLRPVAPYHPPINNVVYWGMDWLCPGYNQVLSNQINKYLGQLTPENTIQDILPIVQTGDVHAVVYDLTDQQMYVSFARPDNSSGPEMAYDRTFTQLDLNKLFAETPYRPSSATAPNYSRSLELQ